MSVTKFDKLKEALRSDRGRVAQPIQHRIHAHQHQPGWQYRKLEIKCKQNYKIQSGGILRHGAPAAVTQRPTAAEKLGTLSRSPVNDRLRQILQQ